MKRSLKQGVGMGAATVMLGLLSVSPGWAHWMRPTYMPVARLMKNIRAYVEAHPKDAHGYYTLGRINSAAFSEVRETIGVFTHDSSPLPDIAIPGFNPSPREKSQPLPPQALTYLSEAIRNYKKASELDPKDEDTWLGLGFQCQEALSFPETVAKAWAALALPGKPDKEKLRKEAVRFYRQAYTRAMQTNPEHTMDFLSVEAAENIVDLQKGHTLSSDEQEALETLKKEIAAFRKKPRPITPILISFQRQGSLSDLLAPEKHVRFDLAGDGLGRSWPWVKPTTGILVWDPKHTGKITSGLQLFGSVTWWLFWKDGYEPLAALDNNRNGWLEGAELEGIAVWFDRNGNGVADAGEVVSLSSLGIKRIATHSAGLADGVPANPNGVQLRDGSSLATFDWTPTSLAR